jgi:hypothetical protein
MPSRVLAVGVLVLALVAAAPRAASADATAFLGFTTGPTNWSARGFAIGFSLVIFGMEFEYAGTTQDPGAGLPSLRTGSFNGLLQTPFTVARMQFYATVGGGAYREVLESHTSTNFVVNTGGGVKVSLFGPVRVRVDYRIFRLSGTALYPHQQRVYVGFNLKF